MSIASELQELSKKNLLRPVDVVEWAKSHSTSALHESFEWDDAKAGHEYRLWQARELITLHIVSEDGAPQMISLTSDRTLPGGGYRRISDVMKSSKLREIALADAIKELRRIKEKYKYLTKLAKVWEALDGIDNKKAANKAA